MSNLYILLSFVSVRNKHVHHAIVQQSILSPQVRYYGEFVLQTGEIRAEPRYGVEVVSLFDPSRPSTFQVRHEGQLLEVMATYRPNGKRIPPKWEISGMIALTLADD